MEEIKNRIRQLQSLIYSAQQGTDTTEYKQEIIELEFMLAAYPSSQ